MGCPPAFPGLEPLPARKSFSTALTGGRVGFPWWWGFPPGICKKRLMEMENEAKKQIVGDLVDGWPGGEINPGLILTITYFNLLGQPQTSVIIWVL